MKREHQIGIRMAALFCAAVFLALAGQSAHAADGDFAWAKVMGGTNYDEGHSIAVDSAGNVYTTGWFQDTVDFDPGVGVFNLISAGNDNIFVSKLDASGNFLWAKQMGGSNYDHGNAIAVDSAGNVYTTGFFQETADFDPGVGIFDLVSAGSRDIFVSKLNASGNFVWAKALGGTGYDIGNSIAVDSLGNVCTTGYFPGTADFDPSAGTFNLIAINDSIFVSKLNSSGNFVWAKAMGGGASTYAVGNSITVDSVGSVFTTGWFSGTADFDPGAGSASLTPSGGSDIFVSKLDTAGNFVLAKAMGGAGSDYGNSIALDSVGNIHTTGFFYGTADFDPGAGANSLISAGISDIFVSKLDTSGNFIWAKAMGGASNEEGNSIDLDSLNNVYTTGFFASTADFDPGLGSNNLLSAGAGDIFISKLDTNGNIVWAKAMGGASDEGAYSVAVDNAGNVHATGYFPGTADFDPAPTTANRTAVGGTDIFVVKLSSPTAFTLSVTSVCNGVVPQNKLTWTPSAGATSYIIYRDGVGIYSGITGTTFYNNNVVPGTGYTYKVRANNAVGNTFSNKVARFTSNCPGAFSLTVTNAPCNGNSPQNKLTWATWPGAISYDVFRDGVAIRSGLVVTTLTSSNVIPGATHTYYIRANTATGNTNSFPVSRLTGTCP